jgi:hypothetical protein
MEPLPGLAHIHFAYISPIFASTQGEGVPPSPIRTHKTKIVDGENHLRYFGNMIKKTYIYVLSDKDRYFRRIKT